MNKIIGRIFSEKYVNHAAVVDNIILLLMYRFTYPFAALLNKLHLSPNQITTQSLVFAIFSFAALVFDDGWILFSVFWGMTVLLDFCDGTVARMANKVSKSAFRYDHMSDLFKISLIILGVGLRYDDYLVWPLAFSVSFVFMYGDALNRELRFTKLLAKTQQSSTASEVSSSPNVRLRERHRIVAWVVKCDYLLKIYKNTYAALFTVNGHTLLLFFIFPFGSDYAFWGFSYLILIQLWAIRSRIATLVVMRR